MTALEIIRWGILGTARINRTMIPALRASGRCELLAIASRSLDRARLAAERYAVPVAHGSYEELLADSRVDAVYVPLPNALHAEWAIRAARAGKHVLCEKPLAVSEVDALSMIETCRGVNVQLMEAFTWRHHPRTTRLREVVSSGAIGVVRSLTATFSAPGEPSPDDIRMQASLGGGALFDLGCYAVAWSHWILGASPRRVSATASFRNGVDVRTSGWLDFGERGTALFDCAFGEPYRAHVEIVGTAGRIRVANMWFPDGRKASFDVARTGAPPEIVAVDGVDQTKRMVETFAEAIARGAPSHPTEAPPVLRSLGALAESSREGRVVEVG
jgi:predicted dehydrogenase